MAQAVVVDEWGIVREGLAPPARAGRRGRSHARGDGHRGLCRGRGAAARAARARLLCRQHAGRRGATGERPGRRPSDRRARLDRRPGDDHGPVRSRRRRRRAQGRRRGRAGRRHRPRPLRASLPRPRAPHGHVHQPPGAADANRGPLRPAHRARARGAAARRRRPHQPGGRRQPLHRRRDREDPPLEHLRQALGEPRARRRWGSPSSRACSEPSPSRRARRHRSEPAWRDPCTVPRSCASTAGSPPS